MMADELNCSKDRGDEQVFIPSVRSLGRCRRARSQGSSASSQLISCNRRRSGVVGQGGSLILQQH